MCESKRKGNCVNDVHTWWWCSFESPLTLAACGGHVELAMLLLERGANIEEVNDEGYTPLMEASREGHEEMVALLLSQGQSSLHYHLCPESFQIVIIKLQREVRQTHSIFLSLRSGHQLPD